MRKYAKIIQERGRRIRKSLECGFTGDGIGDKPKRAIMAQRFRQQMGGGKKKFDPATKAELEALGA
jgi:hypothetical protein